MTKISICKKIISQTRDWLLDENWISAYKIPKHFIRKRLLSMYQVIIFLFYSSLASMNVTLENLSEDLEKLQFPDVTKQAVSKARKGISPKLFKKFFQNSVEQYYLSIKRKVWNGYHLFAIDGTIMELPLLKNIKEEFGFHTEKKSGRQYTQALGSILYDILEDIIVDASIHKDGHSERDAAKQHLKVLKQYNLHKKSIVIVDRGYFSEELYRYIAGEGYFCLFRIQSQYRNAKKMTSDDEIQELDIARPKDRTPIKIRMIRIVLDSGETEYLLTNIFDKKITPKMFQELYFQRWKIETKYHELKSQHYLEEFTGGTPISIKQEFFLKMFVANLASMIKTDADEEINKTVKSDKSYQANRSFIISSLRTALPKIFIQANSVNRINSLLEKAIKKRSQIKKDRKFKRHIKKGLRRKHFNNRKFN